jgi:putative ABC transport system substrate-binding protein
MRRRAFITLLGGATVAWPLATAAQQSAMPVIGFLGGGRPAEPLMSALSEGLGRAGFVEGRSFRIEYRWANNQEDRLPRLAAELVDLRVRVIVAFGSAAVAFAAKQATSTIPIVIAGGIDPVTYGLVSSLNRPGGNITGITWILTELSGKRFDLLCEMVPQATKIAYLSGGARRLVFAEEVTNIRAAAHVLGRQLIVLEASREGEIEAAFAQMVHLEVSALIVGADPYFLYNSDKVLAQTAALKIPTIYYNRLLTLRGGLMSYGTNVTDLFRRVGVDYVARILKGANRADLPVQQPTKFELVINLKTAKALGLGVPTSLLARADEVIE